MKKSKTKYEKSFKIMIVELLESGKTAAEIHREYGLNMNMMYRWRKEYKDKSRPSFTGNGNARMSDLEKENARLKKELKDAKIEAEILKKAVSIFSLSDKKNINIS